MIFHSDGSIPGSGVIFVFGSNLAGRHGKGSAKVARYVFSARYGTGAGRTGNAYAIPTKDGDLLVLPVNDIHRSIRRFLDYARATPTLKFHVTRIGCGLAGYRDHDIAPLFKNPPENCSFAAEWRPFLLEMETC